jgi:large subunit ribosomal protein L6
MRALTVEKVVPIPDGVDVTVDGRRVTASGTQGTITRDFSHTSVSIQKEEESILIRTEWPRKKEAATVATVASHIQNMIKGVDAGFSYKLKIVFSHFPISVKTEGQDVLIENFTGERSPRIAKIIRNAHVSATQEEVVVTGADLEAVSQTAANIEQATKVKVKDPRVFLDGIYVYERLEGIGK